MEDINNKAGRQDSGQTSHLEEKHDSLYPDTSNQGDDIHRSVCRRDSVDKAYEFLRENDSASTDGQHDPRYLRRKIDRNILPILWSLFFFHYLDKYLMGYALVMDMPENLKLRGYELNNCVSALSWSYVAVTPILPLALNKLPVGKWVGFNMFACGLITACTAATKNYGGLLAVRILMGVFDASIVPSITLICSQYYRKDEQALRFGIWFSSVGPSIIVGGAISYGFQTLEHAPMAPWRLMYMTVGIVSALLGALTMLLLPDTPMNARFLSTSEKRSILHHISVNKTGISNNRIELSQVKAVFADPQVWLLFLTILLDGIGQNIQHSFGATIVRGLGYSSKQSALLNMPPGAISLVVILLCAYAIRYGMLSRFWAIAIGLALSVVGAGLVAFLARTNQSGQLAGLWMVSFAAAIVGIAYQWMASNVGGHTKRSISSVLLSAAASGSSIIGPYAIRTQDAPNYFPGKLVLVTTKIGSIVLVTILALYYVWANKRRDRLYGKVDETVTPDDDSETWANQTDQERKSFRYVL